MKMFLNNEGDNPCFIEKFSDMMWTRKGLGLDEDPSKTNTNLDQGKT